MIATLTALAEPTRLEIVEFLRRGPRSVNEVAVELGLRQPQASKHLRVLADAGVVERRADAQQRIYSLNPSAFRDLGGWVGSFSKVWNERIDALEVLLRDEAENDES